MNKKQVEAVFTLCNIEILSIYEIKNQYCGQSCCQDKPWWLVQTKYGMVTIGWRKRVISIEWKLNDPLTLHGKETQPKEDSWVTSWENGVHAYGYAKVVEYMTNFRYRINEQIREQDEDKNR